MNWVFVPGWATAFLRNSCWWLDHPDRLVPRTMSGRRHAAADTLLEGQGAPGLEGAAGDRRCLTVPKMTIRLTMTKCAPRRGLSWLRAPVSLVRWLKWRFWQHENEGGTDRFAYRWAVRKFDWVTVKIWQTADTLEGRVAEQGLALGFAVWSNNEDEGDFATQPLLTWGVEYTAFLL